MDDLEKIKKSVYGLLKGGAIHLQFVPSAVVKLLNLTNQDETRIKDLSRVIETEPALAAKILRNVNSAAFALPHKVSSINRAVNLLGFSALRRLALAQVIYNQLAKLHNRQKFDILLYWRHCLFVAALSRGIALSLKHPDPDMVYAAGLLHDIGKAVLETHGKTSYSDFVGQQKRGFGIEEEQRFFGLTHSEVGHVFCLEWQIPASITAVVACHHRLPKPGSPYEDYRTEAAIVALADHIAWLQGIGSIHDPDWQVSLPAEVPGILDISRLNLDYLLQQTDQEMQMTQEFYGIDFPTVHKLRAALVQSTLHLSTVRTSAPRVAGRLRLASLTAPHQSLDPDEFLPKTLAAIQNDFSLDRVVLLTLDAKHRVLAGRAACPPADAVLPLKIDLNRLSWVMLECMREKKAALIDCNLDSGNPLLTRMNVAEFIIVPVMHKQKLLGLIYADNSRSGTHLRASLLTDLIPIGAEIGTALYHADRYETERRQAQLDPLTQLYNKRMVHEFLTALFRRQDAGLAKIALGFIDIDHFKQVNDKCGHQAGDYALKAVADILNRLTRPGDFIGRYGGEEFIVLLNNINERGAYRFAERIRREIEKRGHNLRHEFRNLRLTASIGIVTDGSHFSCYQDMIERADQAMYQAKHSGRNKVVLLSSKPELNY